LISELRKLSAAVLRLTLVPDTFTHSPKHCTYLYSKFFKRAETHTHTHPPGRTGRDCASHIEQKYSHGTEIVEDVKSSGLVWGRKLCVRMHHQHREGGRGVVSAFDVLFSYMAGYKTADKINNKGPSGSGNCLLLFEDVESEINALNGRRGRGT